MAKTVQGLQLSLKCLFVYFRYISVAIILGMVGNAEG